MKNDHNRPPNFNDKTRWLELEAKREVSYSRNEKGIMVPVLEKRYYREMLCTKNGPGMGMAYVFFNQEAAIIKWNFPTDDGKGHIGYFALRTKNGKWAISNMMINGVSVEDERIQGIQIYMDAREAWIIFKAKKGWCMRKIKKLP